MLLESICSHDISCIAVVTGLTITTPPHNVSVNEGEDVIVTCETSDEGDPDVIEWYEYVTVAEGFRIWNSQEDPSEIDHPEVFEIVGTYNLKIKNISIFYGGKYGCKLMLADDTARTAYVSVFSKLYRREQCALVLYRSMKKLMQKF